MSTSIDLHTHEVLTLERAGGQAAKRFNAPSTTSVREDQEGNLNGIRSGFVIEFGVCHGAELTGQGQRRTDELEGCVVLPHHLGRPHSSAANPRLGGTDLLTTVSHPVG